MSFAVHPTATDTIPELTDEARLAALAPEPQNPAATGLSEGFLADLASKHLYAAGAVTLDELSRRLALSGPIVEKILNFLCREARVGCRPRAEASSQYALTNHGRNGALDALMRSGYVGPAPVPLAQYVRVVRAQSVHRRRVDPLAIRSAFRDVTIPSELRDQLGISMNSGKPVLIYGPAGTGKTTVTQCVAGLFRELVLIPHAVAVDETVVQVFDPLLHESVKLEPDGRPEQGHDTRFVVSERPAIFTGGELSADQLDVRYDAAARVHEAPLQLKANNGLLVIDDLGRQRTPPETLLNRTLSPMNDGRDLHALHSGRRFVTPFDVMLLFSSNLHPLELADEAFLRRISHKIYCGDIDEETYERIWARVCEELKVPFDPAIVHYVIEALHEPNDEPLLPCHPRDLIGIAMDKAAYTGAACKLTEELVDWAWQRHFVVSD